ncbi:MAG TPA: mycofactocin biosynthesis glycosyltransferase MftF [Solirubrobacteraceae bacterium]|nr:mycofactocin biosynthesis glycosyltransferase MftF [Solirubrobacteraceae bacterium]
MTVHPHQPPAVPAGWRLHLDRSARTAHGGSVVFGGSPLCVLRLTAAGAATVRRWSVGEPVGDALTERRLARRLLDAGLAHPDPPPADPAQLTVIIPVRDRQSELSRCLAAIDDRCPVIVVDDGSANGEAVATAARTAGANVVRLDRSRGAAAARNAGLCAVRTPFVAFVDSDCVVGDGFPARLLGHLRDPAVAVVAPRIVALQSGRGGMLGRYEEHHSALDMGEREGLVKPGSAIPYAPSAALVARVAVLNGGFCEQLGMGEDVDLLWRLNDAGWQVRYDPTVSVGHDHRVRWAPWLARRVAYNASNAPLLRRHPGRVPALSISRTGAAFWAAVGIGSPVAAAAVDVLSVVLLGRTLRAHLPAPYHVATRLVVRGELREGRHLARTLSGPWLPAVLAATALYPRLARRIWIGVLVSALWEWAEQPREATPLHYLLPKAAEDVARCIGVWRGCVRERRAGALLPRLRRHRASRVAHVPTVSS